MKFFNTILHLWRRAGSLTMRRHIGTISSSGGWNASRFFLRRRSFPCRRGAGGLRGFPATLIFLCRNSVGSLEPPIQRSPRRPSTADLMDRRTSSPRPGSLKRNNASARTSLPMVLVRDVVWRAWPWSEGERGAVTGSRDDSQVKSQMTTDSMCFGRLLLAHPMLSIDLLHTATMRCTYLPLKGR